MIKVTKVTEKSNIKEWLNAVRLIADENYGGHYTIFSFTTHFKFSFGTITERDEISELTGYDNLKDALINGIQEHFKNNNKKDSLIY